MNILTEIVAHKRIEVAAHDLLSLRRLSEAAPVPRDFLSIIRRRRILHCPGLIAELKRASPSKGMLAPHLNLFRLADLYFENGASAISVLTDHKYFLGEIDTLYDLRFARRSALPLLRKDFIIQESQLYESRASGADAVLLIASVLTDNGLFAGLHSLALELGLTPLVEVHDEMEIERALKLPGLRLVGINNRNLSTFKVSLKTSERLRPMIPPGITVVAESGISTRLDVERMAAAGIEAILVGEALVTAPDIAAKVRELAGMRL